MQEDATVRAKWDDLRKALLLRFASPAEAFVAFGGRTDKALALSEMDRALRDVRERVRTVRPPISIDVDGLMADIVHLFPEGFAFDSFVEQLQWHQAKRPSSASIPEQKSSRLAILRTSAMGPKSKPKVMVGAPAAALRASRDMSANFYVGPLSGGVLSAQWKGSKGPPAHWMTRQRQAASRQAAENVFSDNKSVLRQMKLERKMKVLTDTEERLRAMLQEPTPPVVYKEEEKPLVIPVEFAEKEDPPPKEDTKEPLSRPGKEISERLASIDALVTEQKLSLAETERNVLKRERQDLHAQIRQMDAMHRQSQMAMQQQMKEQMESLMETFHNVGKVMLGGIQAQSAPAPPEAAPTPRRDLEPNPPVQHAVPPSSATEVSPRTTAQRRRQERLQREAEFEQRMQAELLAPFTTDSSAPTARQWARPEGAGAECVISRRKAADDRILGSGLVQDICSGLEASSPAVSCLPQSLRPDVGASRTPDSPMLRALLSCYAFVPICSWYDIAYEADDPGSVGELARMDPVEGEDWVDEFLVEVLVALRLEQVFPGQSGVGWILPVLVGGADAASSVRCNAFPLERLRQLPSQPSVESAKVAAAFLTRHGVPMPESFLRLSVREAIAALVAFADLRLHQFPGRAEAVGAVCRRVAGMVAAEKAANEARAWQGSVHAEPEVHSADADREGRRKRKAALMLFEECYRAVQEEGARARAVGALRRRGLLQEGEDETDLEDKEEEPVEHAEGGGLLQPEEAQETEPAEEEPVTEGWDRTATDDTERPVVDTEPIMSGVEEPADIEEVLRRLQAAVVQTHDKHSQLLQVTRDAKRLDNLAGGLSAAGREAVRDSGVTFADLIEMTRREDATGSVVFDGSGLPRLGLDGSGAQAGANASGKQQQRDTEMVEKFMMAPHIWDREGEWGVGGGVDEKERKERLKEDLEALQGALQRKSARTQLSTQAVEQLGTLHDSSDDGICGTLNSLLFALGKDGAPPGSQGPSSKAPTPLPAAVTEDGVGAEARSGAEGGGEAGAAAEAGGGNSSLLGSDTEEEIGRLDREMEDYLEKLGKEDDAQQEVMQYLASGLAEVRAGARASGSAGFGDDLEAGMERQRMEASQVAMEKTVRRFEEAMSNAKRLLGAGTEAGRAQEEQPKVGVEAGGLTTAEQEAVKLEEDMQRRADQAEALAQENLKLREQLRSSRDRGSAHGRYDPAAADDKDKVHWSAAIQDEELASKYKDYGEGEDAFYSVGAEEDRGQLDDRFLRPEMLQELLAVGSEEVGRPHLAWGLEQVQSLSHITRASVFETVLEERVRKTRKVMRDKVAALTREQQLLQSEEADATATLDRVKNEQAAMVREGAKAAKGAVVLLKEREVREAKAECDEIAAKRLNVEAELQRLEEEAEALDWRAELEKMKDKERDECAAVESEISKLKEDGDDTTEEGRSKIAELTRKIGRTQETWVLRRNLKEKEIEIEVLGQKMEEDEQGLRLEKRRLQSAFQENANTAQEELSHTLVSMEEHVARTARGRCRPEVMSSLSGVRKVMGAVQRHRAEMAMALEEEKRQEREQLKAERRKEAERAEAAQLEEEMAKARATTDMTLREKRLQLIADAVAKHRQASLDAATALLDDAEKAVAAAPEVDGDAGASFNKMLLRTVEGGAKHARTFAAEAKKLLLELQGAATTPSASSASGTADDGSQAVQERTERLAGVEQSLASAEDRLLERIRAAQTRVEAMQKMELSKAAREQVKEVAEHRDGIAALLRELEELSAVDDAKTVRGRDLATREQRLRASWQRTAPRIEEALRRILVKGDACLDSVQAALKAGKVSSAVAELGNAQLAYDKFKAGKAEAAQKTA